jgi:hypothetical protein
MSEAGIPESDLIPLAIRDPDGLAKVGMLRIQKIHLLTTI